MIWRGIFLLMTLILLGLTGCIALTRASDTPSTVWTMYRMGDDGAPHTREVGMHLTQDGQYIWRYVSVRYVWPWFGLSAGWTVYAAALFRRAWIRRLDAA